MKTLLLLAAVVATGGQLLESDFEKPLPATGWQCQGDGRRAPRPDGRGYGLVISEGCCQSPEIPFSHGDYYEASYTIWTTGTGYAWAVFLSADDKVLDSDHATGYDPSATWERQRFCFRGRRHQEPLWAALRFAPHTGELWVDDVVVRPVTHAEVAAWADSVYATIPPVDYAPPADRWQYLPRAMQTLRDGGTLRVVMLGDSIVNDTANSAWEVLVERQYPGTRIEVVAAVRGGTGCGWYRRNNRIDDYVLRYAPDLVMIGGISQHRAEDVAECIGRIRAGTDAEIMLMTGPFGRDLDPRDNAAWAARHSQAAPRSFDGDLRELAAREKCAFLDLAGAWADYIRGHERPLADFKRDGTHANARGGQSLARILLRWFTPD